MRTLAVVLAAVGLWGTAQAALPERRINTDEAKVPAYTLEDVLVSTNGTRITTAAQWPERRREMLALIERELYGKWPSPPQALVIDEQKEHRTFYDLARIRQFTMYFRADRSGPRIDWMLLEPAQARGPIPVIVMLNYRGNHEHLPEACVGVSDFWVDSLRQRGATTNRIDASVRGQMRYPYDLVLARGYAVLTACYHQAAPDPLPEEMPLEEVRSRGLYQLWSDRDIGTLSVWGWTMCRGLDLAARLPELDMKRTVAYGYSRLAKAALIAGAFDERFAVVVPCQPGGGGVALQKRQFGENADWMTQVFPHWFCSAYQKYANNEAAMPLDQHFLVAVVAPRRLLVQGFDEAWYDTKGEWLSCRAAAPAWELLGKKGLSADAWPADFATDAMKGDIAYVRRTGTHGISGYDWMWMLDFADESWRRGVGPECDAAVPEFARGARDMGPILGRAETRRNAKLKGRFCSYFCDDAIWCLRDLTRQRPKSMFDHPFFAVLKECHEKYGLKMQINLFYRTDFFYGMDEFTLKDVTDAYKAEFAANADWLKLGFHSLQEFPDYPWINADYADVKNLFDKIHGEVVRFAGEASFARACVPHWCPMSKDGVRALKDSGIRVMECSIGPRYAFDGKAERLPYGHAFRLLQNRKPETGFYWRDSRNAAISASICSYNHISEDQARQTSLALDYIHDRDTGMNFKHMFCDAPCLNLCTLQTLKEDITKVLGREYLIFSNHEQYFFKDYLAYQPEYADKIRLMCRMMTENGYTFMLMQDLVD